MTNAKNDNWIIQTMQQLNLPDAQYAVFGSGLLDVLGIKKANDIEYWGGACTRSEALQGSCNGGIDGRLVHPLEPRSLRASLRIGF